MTTSPAVALGLMQNAPLSDWYATAKARVESCLTSPKWMADWRRGHSNAYYWSVIINGEGTAADREQLRKDYVNAGWFHVTVRTSSANDERRGLCGITLYLNP